MKSTNEKTSKRVAAIAGRVLKRIAKTNAIFVYDGTWTKVCTVDEFKALAASALTQAPNKKRRKK